MAARRLLLTCLLAAGCGSAETQRLEDLRFSVSAEVLDFSEVPVGTRVEREVQVKNLSTADLTLRGEVGEDWDDAFDFSPASLDLAVDATRTVRIAFEPTASGELVSTLRLRSDDPRVPEVALRLQGTGVAGCEDLEVTPRRLEFGPGVLESSQQEQVTLRNVGAGDLEVQFEEEDNVGDCDGATGLVADFCVAQAGVVDAGRISIPAGQSVALQARFQPVVPGSTSGFFTLRAHRGCDEIPIAVSGVGVDTGLTCDARLDFGIVFPGDCKTETLTCENVANEAAAIVDVEPRGGDPMANALTVTGTIPFGLAEGESAVYQVTYCPTERGALDTQIQVSPERGERIDVPVTGQAGGPDLRLEPSELDFGEVAILSPARTRLTVRNGGFETLEVTDIELGSLDLTADATVFAVEPGEARVVVIELQSLAAGPVRSTLTIRSNDPDTPETTVPVRAEAVSLSPCSFRADTAVSLGTVEPGRVATGSVLIENTGNDDCLVTSLRALPGGDPEFFLPDAFTSSFRIPAGQAARVRIGYAPDAPGTHATQLEIGLSSRTQPFTVFTIEGSSQVGLPLIYPRALDFGTLGSACTSRSLEFRVHNRIAASITVTGLELVTPARPGFVATPARPLPLSIPTNGVEAISVRFDPSSDGEIANALRVSGTSDIGPWEVVVDLVGARAPGAPKISERFTQGTSAPVDLLLSVDFSANNARLLPAGLSPLISTANTLGADWHVGVVSDRAGDGGVLVGPVGNRFVDLGDADPNLLYQQILGTPMSGFMEPFSQFLSAERALSWPTAGTQNAGFLRREARLGLFIAARTAERSPGSIAYYEDLLRSLKGPGRKNDVAVAAYAGPTPTGCQGSLFASATPRIEQFVQALAGTFGVYCDPLWDQGMASFGAQAVGWRDVLFLDSPAEPGSVEVVVDGVLLPEMSMGGAPNYTYDAARVAVVFPPVSQPALGSDVELRYAASCR